MSIVWIALEFRMKLPGNKKFMRWYFDNFWQFSIWWNLDFYFECWHHLLYAIRHYLEQSLSILLTTGIASSFFLTSLCNIIASPWTEIKNKFCIMACSKQALKAILTHSFTIHSNSKNIIIYLLSHKWYYAIIFYST